MKKAALGVLFTLLTLPLMAQKRLFTINDLIPGGSTYYQASMPETEYLTWWGDACIKLDMSHCQQVGTESARPEVSSLTLENINSVLADNGRKTIDHLYNAAFPDAEKPYILIDRGRERTLIDWVNHQVIWKVNLTPQASNMDWNEQSKAMAYTVEHNLFVTKSLLMAALTSSMVRACTAMSLASARAPSGTLTAPSWLSIRWIRAWCQNIHKSPPSFPPKGGQPIRTAAPHLRGRMGGGFLIRWQERPLTRCMWASSIHRQTRPSISTQVTPLTATSPTSHGLLMARNSTSSN